MTAGSRNCKTIYEIPINKNYTKIYKNIFVFEMKFLTRDKEPIDIIVIIVKSFKPGYKF